MKETSAVSVKWSSRVEFVVALRGYSIGMPEFWRVPYLTYRNGGGMGIAIAVINGISAINTAIMEAWAFEYFVNSFKAVLSWTNCDNDWNTPACYREGPHTITGNLSVTNSSTGNYSKAPDVELSIHIKGHHENILQFVIDFYRQRIDQESKVKKRYRGEGSDKREHVTKCGHWDR